jgi:signal transduction histidine kinase
MGGCIPNQLFEGLSPAECAAAEAVGHRHVFAPGTAIIREGERGDAMYLIMRGEAEMTKRAPSGKELVWITLGPGSFFGEMTLLHSAPRFATCTSKTEVETLVYRKPELEQVIALSPQIGLNLAKVSNYRLREALKRLVEESVYQEKMALVGQMASSIAHDFRSPLAAVRMAAEMIAVDPKDPQVPEFCQLIIRNVDRASNMATDVLDFAQDTIRLDRQELDPVMWLRALQELLQPVLLNRRIEFRIDVRCREKLRIDGEKMTRVLFNLARNSVEAMPEGGSLRVRVDKDERGHLLEVSDTGRGIPPEIRDRLFQVFVTFGKKNGTGLGTAIARRIVELHGGTISFETETGKGTTFRIILPAS